MARLDEIFQKYGETAKLNTVSCNILSRPGFSLNKFPLVLDLNKIDGKEMLFSINEAPLRLQAEKELELEGHVEPDGERRFHYLL